MAAAGAKGSGPSGWQKMFVGEKALYDQTKPLGRVASSSVFQYTGLVVTGAYLVWEAIEVDYNTASSMSAASPIFQVAFGVFLGFFALEAVARFLALRDRRQVLRCPALVWDIALVFFLLAEAVLPLTNATGVRLCRLFIMLQLTRAGRFFRTSSTRRPAPAVATAKGSLAVLTLTYVFSIALTMLSRGAPVGEKYFPTVLDGMTSLASAIVTDAGGFLGGLLESGAAAVLYVVFVLLVLVVVAQSAWCVVLGLSLGGTDEHKYAANPAAESSEDGI